MNHTCHAWKCRVEVPPAMFMCKMHWFMLPGHLRRDVWRHYVPGQEETKTPTNEYLDVARRAIEWLKEKEYPNDQPQPR